MVRRSSRHRSPFAAIVLLAGLGLAVLPSPSPATPSIAWQDERPVVPGAKGFTVAADGRVLCWATRREDGRALLRVFESRDGGRTFAVLDGVVTSDVEGVDLGDASLLAARDGSLWISYRHNHPRGDRPRFAIKTSRSTDDGRTWSTPAIVAESVGERGKPSRGLWASFLFERSDGIVQCYYDDEDTPFDHRLGGHQWITMKMWDGSAWSKSIVASRAHDGKKLSRDGMMSVIEISPNRLLMTFESVSPERPHENVIRRVTSEDGGETWSWTQREREIVYASPKHHLAFAPWMASLADGRLICVFVTDEDRDVPSVSGTPAHRIKADVKYVISNDAGKTWSASTTLADESHRYYLPGVAVRKTNDTTEVLVTYVDFASGECRLARGVIAN